MPLQLSNASRLQITARGPIASHVHWLDKGATALVGAGESCGLRLRHASVAALHCLLRSDDNGRLWVQPWSETAAVLVDGEPLAEEREVAPVQEIQIGEFRLSIRAAADPSGEDAEHAHGAAIGEALAVAPADSERGAEHAHGAAIGEALAVAPAVAEHAHGAAISEALAVAPAVAEHAHGTAISEALAVASADSERGAERGAEHAHGAAIGEALAVARADAAPLTAGWEAVDPSWWECDWESQELDQPLDQPLDSPLDSPRREVARPPIRGAAVIVDLDLDVSLDRDVDGLRARIQSLEAEVAQLQGDLMQRESELTAGLPLFGAASPASAGPLPDDSPSAAADMVPAARFEGAMAELEQSDERISELEALLRLAEEAQVAEREERQLIEAWVGDLEARAADHDRERAAELELLRKRLQRSQEEVGRLGCELTQSHAACREALETRRSAPSVEASQAAEARESAAARRLLEAQASAAAELREENAALRGHLQAAAAELDESLARLQRIEEESAASDLRSRVDDALRAERLQMAQDRAAVAREKAELARQLGELEHQLQTARQHSGAEIDSRIHAFREHLRSIHDKEPRDAADRKGLGSRLSRLWRRLEGDA